MDMYIISIVTENALRVLQRMSGMFSRYQVNIEQMSIFNNKTPLSYFTVMVYSKPAAINKLTKQLAKIIEVQNVTITNHIGEKQLIEHHD